MDTDSVVFTQQPGQWKPQLGNFLGNGPTKWSAVPKSLTLLHAAQKNYGYVTRDVNGVLKTSKKVKGLRLTDLVGPL